MDYNINLGAWGSVFAVPSAVVENYIKLSSGNALKVLLYVLCKNSAVAIDVIMADLNLSKEVVEDAFCFWEQVGLFGANAPPTVALPMSTTPTATTVPTSSPIPTPPTTTPPPETNPTVESPVPALLKQHSTTSLTPREIAERIESSESIAFLFHAFENSNGSLLTHTEQRSLIWIHDYLGLPADVIIMLIDYCKVLGKSSARYMERVALTWQEKDILTVEAAEIEIATQQAWHTLSTRVASAFGINRKLSTKEEGFISDWMAKKFEIDLISYAYDKTIDSIGKLSFPYTNKILMAWADKGLHTRAEIDNMNATAPKFEEHSYDPSKFDELAIRFTANDKPNESGGKL